MIAETYKCGCPAPKQSRIKPVGFQTSCSPCCVRPSRYSYEQITSQCIQFETIQKLKRDKVPCRISRQNLKRIPSSYSSIKSKLEKLEPAEQTSTEKIVSEIVKKKQPYKEIEAVINDNRVIIRMHKEKKVKEEKEEFEPPCECIDQDVTAKSSTLNLEKCADGITFDMTNGSLELCRTSREDTSLMKKTCDQNKMGCPAITLYPNIKEGDDAGYNPAVPHVETEKSKIPKVRPIDLEENPNIFVLRIKKHCGNGDKRHRIDLEFRAPRPWRPRKEKKKEFPKISDEMLEEHKESDNKNNNVEI